MKLPELVEMLAQTSDRRRYIMLIGPQGSGKSTLAKALRDRGFKRLSCDKLQKRRPWLTEGQLEQLFNDWLDKKLAKGTNIVDDNLNIDREVRRETLAKVRPFDYDFVLVHFDLPLELCQEQNQKRNRQAAPWAVERVWRRFNKSGLPNTSEATGELIHLRRAPIEEADAYLVERQATVYREEPRKSLLPAWLRSLFKLFAKK